MQNKILFIGPRNNVMNPEITGGVIVLFEDLLTYCDANNIAYIYIDTNKVNYKNKLVSYISILYQLVTNVKTVQYVSLHGTANDYLYIAPFALILSKIYAKHFSLRKFAGNFIEVYGQYSYMKKILIRFVLKHSDVNFFETKYLIEYFQRFNQHTYWFPNVRHRQKYTVNNDYTKKFIFLGNISKEKGIDILCQAALGLSDDYHIDVYGKIEDTYTKEYLEKYNVHYLGEIKHENVIAILLAYDVLILPSYREGYPGVIIEALSIGLPIIATKLKGIQEMIDAKSSVLFEVGSVDALKKAIESFNENNYRGKSKNARKQFEQFNSDIQTKKYLNTILSNKSGE